MSIRKSLPIRVLVFFSIFHSAALFAQLPPVNFEQISNQAGLLSNTIYCAEQDRLGFMWFGTEKGLSRYDGKKFYTLVKENGTLNSLSNNTVRTLLTDKQDNLWIGTQGGGLNKYHIPSRTFVHYQHIASDSNSINNDEVLSLHRGSRGLIWVGTEEGLNAFNPETEKFYRIPNKLKEAGATESAAIMDITEDSQGTIWVGVWQGGLRKLIWNQEESSLTQAFFEDFMHDENNAYSIPSNRITSLAIDANDRVWTGSYGHGLSVLTGPACKDENQRIYKLRSSYRKGFGNNIFTTLIDSRGYIWLGTSKDLQVTDPRQVDLCEIYDTDQQLPFKRFKHTHIGISGLPRGSIRGLFESREGIIWVLTEGGLGKYDPRVSVFESFIERKDQVLNPVGGFKSIFKSKESGTWIASKEGLFNYQSGKLTKAYCKEQSPDHQLPSNIIVSVYEDTLRKFLWMASHTHISRVDLRTQVLIHKALPVPGSKKNAYISRFYFSKAGKLWISTHQGLFILDPSMEKVDFYQHNPQNPSSLPKGRIYQIKEDNEGSFWIGSELGGLIQAIPQKNGTVIFKNHLPFPETPASLKNKYFLSVLPTDTKVWVGSSIGLYEFDKKTGTFQFFDKEQGLKAKVINHLQIDQEGNIWGASNEFVIRFEPKTRGIIHFDYRNGLFGANFASYLTFKDSQGKIYFGSDKGIMSVDPTKVNLDFDTPKLYLTELSLNGNLIKPHEPDKLSGKTILSKSLSETDKIQVGTGHRMISLNLATIQYHLSENNQAAYKLEGFEKDWNLMGIDPTISYMNLDPGNYKLYTKGASNNGEWSEEKLSLSIEILPSFWETIYFKILVGCLILGLIFWINHFRSRQVLRQNQLLQEKINDRTMALKVAHEQEKEARSHAEQAVLAKSQFLANMSHEIRTPMNGVLGMAELLNDQRLDTDQRDYIETIIKSGESLLAIINDILDLSKIESGKLELEENPFNLRDSVEEVLGLFAGKIQQKPIELLYTIKNSLPEIILGDKLRLQQVLINLVGNALKFTTKGEILVEVKMAKFSKAPPPTIYPIEFTIIDTGIGIPEEKQKGLFDSFTQVDASTTRKYGGTGLGLSISSHLVKLMGGHLHVKSKVGVGSTFYFTIQTPREELYQADATINKELGEFAGKKVLILDTNVSHSKLLLEVLDFWEIEATLAENMTELSAIKGLENYEGFISNYNTYSKVELESFIQWKKQYPKLRAIHLSPLISVPENKKLGIFEEVLHKPVKRSTLRKALRKLLTDAESPRVFAPSPNSERSQEEYSEVKVLLAEDNPVNQKLAMRVLQKLGFQPNLAKDGMEVLCLLENQSVDIILMDIQMPELDGLETTRRIRSNPNTPQPFIIAMTANAMKGDRKMCLEAGMDDYISKPFKQQELKELLDSHMKNLPKFSQV